MTLLVPMTGPTFARWLASASAAYAQDNIQARRWSRDDALALARKEFDSLLPQGLATPHAHLLEIRAQPDGPAIGVLWFAVEEGGGQRSGFVYDVEIDLAWRRRGHARRAFEALEAYAEALGIERIGLHVFAHNPGAQAFYAGLGYEVSGVNMGKCLSRRAEPSDTTGLR